MQVANERGFTLGTARLQVAHLPDGSTGFWGTAPGGGPIATRLGVEAAPWQAALEVQGTDEAQVELECSTEGWQYSLDQSTPRQFRKGLRSVVAVQVLFHNTVLWYFQQCSTVAVYYWISVPTLQAAVSRSGAHEKLDSHEEKRASNRFVSMLVRKLTVCLSVQVLEGRGIVSKDFNGLSDPYVVVSYNKRDALTRTVWKSLNPVFGDVMLFQENRYSSQVSLDDL